MPTPDPTASMSPAMHHAAVVESLLGTGLLVGAVFACLLLGIVAFHVFGRLLA